MGWMRLFVCAERDLYVGQGVRGRVLAERPFRLRVHRQGREVLVAVSDAALVGRDFREGGLRLSVSEHFYGTDAVDATEVLRQLSMCTIANLVGVDVVTLAIRHGFVHPDRVLDVAGVPHAQMCTA